MAGLPTREDFSREQRSGVGPSESLMVPVKTGHGVEFPKICPACGAQANAKLRVERVFPYRLDSDDGNKDSQVVLEYRIPFCARCVAQHKAELPASDPLMPFKRVLRSDGTSVGGLVVCAVAVYFTLEAVRTFSLTLAAFALLPWSVGLWLVGSVWRQNRYMAVAPPTPVSLSVEFSDDLSRECEPAWQIFRFRDQGYATRFRAMNALRLWDPSGDEAREAKRSWDRRSRRNKFLMYGVLGAAVAWWLWSDYLQPLYEGVREWVER